MLADQPSRPLETMMLALAPLSLCFQSPVLGLPGREMTMSMRGIESLPLSRMLPVSSDLVQTPWMVQPALLAVAPPLSVTWQLGLVFERSRPSTEGRSGAANAMSMAGGAFLPESSQPVATATV